MLFRSFFGKTADLLLRSKPTITAVPVDPKDLERLAILARAAGHDARIEGLAIHIDAPEDWGAELNRLAYSHQIILKQITPIRPTLEETFFEMTEEK